MRTLYTILLRLALPFLVLRLWWRGRGEAGYREAIPERFGAYGGEVPAPLVWIHAVSVGEARAAEPFARALMQALPDYALLFTCTTATGRETLRQLFGGSAAIAWLPYDYPEPVQAFLERFRPRLGIIMETEIWPNLLAGCAARGVPVLLANARMSEKSARGYRRWGALTRPAFASLARVCAQSDADAGRLIALGAREVTVAGNLKFDAAPDLQQLEEGRAWRRRLARPVVLLASTRDGEETPLLEALAPLQGLVVVVPRHARRFDEVAKRADSRRSAGAFPGPGERVHLGDTMGEMAFYYGACDVAVIGGSFAPLGGQGLIEALACGAAVVMGPHMFNFAEAARLALESGAAVQADGPAQAAAAALALLADSARRDEMGRRAQALCQSHRGATARHVEACRALITPARG
jgi:3-deoxy-D-manno-octulosonic-acid transferase